MKRLMTSCAAIMLLLVARALVAENAPPTLPLAEINKDIWEPFTHGVSTFDHALYARVRAKDSVFVDGKRLFGYDEYVDDAVRVMTPLQQSGTRIEMQVRFEERITDGAHAFERGVLRTIVTDKSGARRTGYTHFQVISRKEQVGWRIVTDYRWRTDIEQDARAFDSARPMDSPDGLVR
jgi:hypothetical protein